MARQLSNLAAVRLGSLSLEQLNRGLAGELSILEAAIGCREVGRG